MSHLKLRRFFALSIAVHALMLGIAWCLLRNETVPSAKFVSFSYDPIASRFAMPSGGKSGRQRQIKKSLSDFKPRYRFFESGAKTTSNSEASAFGTIASTGEALDSSFNDYPVIKALYERIDQNFNYAGTELGQKEIQGSMNLTLKIKPDGQVEILDAPKVNGSAIRGFILDQIVKALEKPLERNLVERSVVVYLHVELANFDNAAMVPKFDSPIKGHVVHLFKYVINPPVVTFDNVDLVDKHGVGAMVDLVAAWKFLFGNEKPEHRLEWDIEYRKQEFIRACENQDAEGGCYKAGLIEKALGHNDSAVQLMQRACQLKLEEACLWLKKQS